MRIPIGVAAAILAAVVVSGCTSGSSGGDGGPASASAPGGAQVTTTMVTPSSTPSSSPASAATSTAATASSSASGGPSGGAVPAGFTPTSATFVSADDGWVLGTAPCSTAPCTSVLRTRDGGRSWAGIPAPRGSLGQPGQGRNGDVAVLRFADQLDGWAGVTALFSTHDGGASWVRQGVPGGTGTVERIESGGGRVYVSVGTCPSDGSVACPSTVRLYSSPIGTDRFAAVTGTLSARGVDGLVVHGSDWYLSTSSGVYHGTGTSAGSRLPNPCPSSGDDPSDPYVAVADSSHLDAVCVSGGAGGSASYQLYGSTDGGRSWAEAGPSRREFSGLYGVADNGHGVLLEAVASAASGIERTTDDGATVHYANLQTASGGIEWADLGFTTSTQAIVVLDGTAFYVSRDSGQSFQRVTF